MVLFSRIYSFVIFLLLGLTVNIYAKDDNGVLKFGWNEYVQVCGGQLGDMLSAACNGKYNDYPVPSGPRRVRDTGHTISYSRYLEKRKREGPATVCCQNYCQVRALKAYCIDQSITSEFLIVRKRYPVVDFDDNTPLTTTMVVTKTTAAPISTTTAAPTSTTTAAPTSTTSTTVTTEKNECSKFCFVFCKCPLLRFPSSFPRGNYVGV